MSTAPFDLTTFQFTNDDDEVFVNDIVDIFSGNESPFHAIFVPGESSVDALDGDDIIDGTLFGTIDTPDFATISGLELFEDATLVTGRQNDTVKGTVDYFGSTAVNVLDVAGIRGRNSSVIETGKNNDTVMGHAEATSADFTGEGGEYEGEVPEFPEGDNAFRVRGILDGVIDTGRGRDDVSGFAHGMGSTGFGEVISTAIGIDNADIDTGRDSDTVEGEGKVTLQDGAFAFAAGIAASSVSTGNGSDTVDGAAVMSAGAEAGLSGAGLDDSVIDTGGSNDAILGTADVTIDSGSVNARGIQQSTIDAGRGNDDVTGSVVINGGASTDIQGTDGIANSTINTGAGADNVTGSVEATLGDNANSFRDDGISGGTINTENGNDTVTGSVDLTLGQNSSAIGIDGINFATVNTGSNSDVVIGSIAIDAGAGSTVTDNDGIDGGIIDTGRGDDFVQGTSTITGTGLATAFGAGIANFDILTGQGDDTVEGIGAAIAVNGGSRGLEDGILDLGDGDDQVLATGATEGIRKVDIFGGDGDDIFNLQSGSLSSVDGGDDFDLLILDGVSSDFTFTDLGGSTGTITGGGNDLAVAGIEQFQFDDNVFAFGDLFI